MMSFFRDKQNLARIRRDVEACCKGVGLPVPVLVVHADSFIKLQPGSDAQQPSIIFLPCEMLRRPAEETVDEIFELLVDRDILSKAFIVTRKDYPRLIDAYEQLCMANGLHNVPPLLGTKSHFTTGAALHEIDCIMLSEATLALPIDKALSIISHEMGHLLDKQDDPKKSEQAADSFSVKFMGKTRPVVATLKRSIAVSEFNRLCLDVADISETRSLSSLDARLVKKAEHECYGKASDRLAFIRAQNPDDRSHIEALIEARNALPPTYGR